ncbi:MAG: DNA pilot protein [Microviridae sp.]|nr:MAG: DNA pilot protein [Microviridae sp.]
MADWLGIGLQAAETAGNLINQKVQYDRTKKLMDIQQMHQQQLNTQGQQLQMKTWEETNYPAQMEMLKKAGLNPGLMYAKGGQGGTTGSQGGGSASMGAAPQAQKMDITNIMAMKSMEAAIEAQKAGARKANAEADVIEKYGGGQAETGIKKTETEAGRAAAETENIKAQTEINKIKAANSQREIDVSLANTVASTNRQLQENSITAETRDSIVKLARETAVGKTIENSLAEEKINLTKAEIEAISNKIVQEYMRLDIENVRTNQANVSLDQKDRELAQKDMNLKIEKFKAEIAAEYPGIGQAAGSVLKKAWMSLENSKEAWNDPTRTYKDRIK